MGGEPRPSSVPWPMARSSQVGGSRWPPELCTVVATPPASWAEKGLCRVSEDCGGSSSKARGSTAGSWAHRDAKVKRDAPRPSLVQMCRGGAFGTWRTRRVCTAGEAARRSSVPGRAAAGCLPGPALAVGARGSAWLNGGTMAGMADGTSSSPHRNSSGTPLDDTGALGSQGGVEGLSRIEAHSSRSERNPRKS